MAEILHQIAITAPARKVFEALTTAAGLAGWWTPDVKAEARRGSIAEFGFNGHRVVFRMRVDTLETDRRVAWTCEGDVDEWKGTRLQFELDDEGGHTTLRFSHTGWRSTDGIFRICNTDWGRLMYSLKDYAEGRDATPFMS